MLNGKSRNESAYARTIDGAVCSISGVGDMNMRMQRLGQAMLRAVRNTAFCCGSCADVGLLAGTWSKRLDFKHFCHIKREYSFFLPARNETIHLLDKLPYK